MINRFIPSIFIVAIGAILSACSTTYSSTYSLVAASENERGFGSFSKVDDAGNSSMVIEYKGKRFEAKGFKVEKGQNQTEVRQAYTSSSKHYDRIFMGFDTEHMIYQAQPVLVAADGSMLKCDVRWRTGGVPVGECVTSSGEKLKISADQ